MHRGRRPRRDRDRRWPGAPVADPPAGRLGCAAIALLLALVPAGAAALSASERQGPAARAPALRGEAVGAFFDQVLPAQLAWEQLPGAAVALVQGGEVLHLGGYGLADLASGRPVSPQETLFRTGSVSKVFTATAVMQLVEQGRLDLHADVNQYLTGLQIPPTFPEPITLAHLLTHTAGFEDWAFGHYARSPAGLTGLGTFLARHQPARIFPPGEVSAYSNYGAALAGHLVERASGATFETYVESHILAPLGMTSSSFRQPLPTDLANRLATGYRASLTPGAFEWDRAVPAGALVSSAADMARFLIAHLQRGRLGEVRILDQPTAEAMQRRALANHPAVSGLTYGWQELHIGGTRILAQPGDRLHFTAAVFLLPELDLGLFVAYNRGRAPEAPMALLRAFLDWLAPTPPWALSPPEAIAERDLSRFAGSYRSTRRNETTFARLQGLFAPVDVRAVGADTLEVSGLAVVPHALWTEIAPGVFRDRASLEQIAFREDANGRVTHLFEGNFPAAGYTRLPWHAVPALHLALIALCVPVFLISPVVWWVSGRRHPSRGQVIARRARLTAGAMCVVNLLLLAGLSVVIAQGRELLFGITPLARAVLALPLLSLVLTALALFYAVLAVTHRLWGVAGRLHDLLVIGLGVAFLASLGYWNLLGLRF